MTDSASIHPTALIDPSARLGQGVVIGPYVVIGPDCDVADGVRLGAHVTLQQNTRIGHGTVVHSHACLGGDPQDISYRGETTWLEVGANCQIREQVTLHRGSKAGNATRIGDGCLLMTTAHIGHDCQVGNHVIIASNTVVAGHVEVQDYVFISGNCAIHQHCRLGAYSILGGGSAIRQDIPPFCKASGFPALLAGLNSVGLRRQGISSESRMALKRAYKIIWNSGLSTKHALEMLKESADALDANVARLIAFMESSPRGVVSPLPKRDRKVGDLDPDALTPSLTQSLTSAMDPSPAEGDITVC